PRPALVCFGYMTVLPRSSSLCLGLCARFCVLLLCPSSAKVTAFCGLGSTHSARVLVLVPVSRSHWL
uniref:Uncharacterized protein n=1 Tax=Cannabis sativa TaxID=3483 RepID=A0A803QSM2_CANSA